MSNWIESDGNMSENKYLREISIGAKCAASTAGLNVTTLFH